MKRFLNMGGQTSEQEMRIEEFIAEVVSCEESSN